MKYILAGLLTSLLFAVNASATPFSGSVLISCNLAAHAQVDPIVAYGSAMSAHDHAFWGSDQASSTTTLPKLLAGGTSCDIKSDKSLYWHPTIIAADGHTVVPNRSSFYYRGANRGGPVHPFPAGLRFVSGNPSNTTFPSAAAFRCGAYYARRIPTDCNGTGMQEDIFVTSCWNGLDLGTGGGGTSTNPTVMFGTINGTCPASHPILLPSLQFIINWPADAVGGRLSCDSPTASAGACAHVDFFNGWTFNSKNEDALSLLVDKCLNVDSNQVNPASTTCQSFNGGIYVYTNARGAFVTD